MDKNQLIFEKTKCIYENAIKQLESFRNTGYKIILSHTGLNISVVYFIMKTENLYQIIDNKCLIYIALWALWFIFFWWQVGLYLSAGRLNKIRESCLAKLSDEIIDIPSKKKTIFRRFIPDLLIQFFSTLLCVLWVSIQ